MDTTEQLKASVDSLGFTLELLVDAARDNVTDHAATLKALQDWGFGEDWTVNDDDEIVDAEGDEVDIWDICDKAQSAISEAMLDLEIHGKRDRHGEWEVTHVVAVFATGGPHIEVDTARGDVLGYWGGDKARYPLARDVVDYFDQMGEL